MAMHSNEERIGHGTMRINAARTRSLPNSSLYVTGISCFVLLLLNLRGGFVLLLSNDRSASHPQRDHLSADSEFPFLSDQGNVHQTKTPRSYEIDLNLDDLQPSKNETIVVGLSNKAYAPVAVLWYRRMTEAGFTNHRILAADKATARTCEDLGLRYDDLSKYTQPIVPTCSAGMFHNNVWNQKRYLFAVRWIYVRQKLLEGYHVLMSDVDAVYNYNDHVSKLEQGGFDHYTAYANRMPEYVFQQTGFTICGCFNWMRSTPSMVRFLNMFLSNCGCTARDDDRNGLLYTKNHTCNCGCDDQITMNSMLLFQLDMKWDRYRGSWTREFLQNSLTGTSGTTGQRLKILDRSFVYRGHDENTCPEGNWITFPKTNNETETKVEQMHRLLGNCPLQSSQEDSMSLPTLTTRQRE